MFRIIFVPQYPWIPLPTTSPDNRQHTVITTFKRIHHWFLATGIWQSR